ncbi:MAG: Rpn family recombination-promoting nuclease/putative transposase [Rickettsiaceae bacterium]|nr:Rpn family recombination-promoting nuclease/putative transposase [Rickettsiaceae bacterium]
MGFGITASRDIGDIISIMNDLISFDYAIKYLLKDKEDYDIVEGFISAIISCKGYKPVKIKALLDSESNKESKYLKRSIADLIVCDEEGNNFIVEIDRTYTDLFLNKALFNTSRLIVDSLSTSQDYSKIKKIFHINLLYFELDSLKHQGIKGALNHGQVVFHEVNNNDPIDMHLIDRKMHIYDLHNIFPEYFIISIPSFDGIIRREIDEWLYVMKNSSVKEDFTSPYMKKVAERLSILSMNTNERRVYDEYMMESLKNRDYLVSAETKGREEGLVEGEAIGITKIATNMLKKGHSLEDIAELTGLSIEDIKNL